MATRRVIELETMDGVHAVVPTSFLTQAGTVDNMVRHGVWISDTEWVPPHQIKRVRLKEVAE